MKDFTEKLKNLPQTPGVYLMKDIDGRIIYVGKAKVLKNRVSQYFHKSANHSPKTVKMVENIETFDLIETANEVEALILEANLIKQHFPKYNILLKDDKQYPYIKITNEDFPRIMVVRQQTDDGARYFGQFISGFSVKENIEIIRKIFKLRTCTKNLPRDCGKSRPCLLYHIKRCNAPCARKITAREYHENVNQAITILEGKSDLISELTAQMNAAAELLEFERAAKIRDKIKHIQKLDGERAGVAGRNLPLPIDEQITDFAGEHSSPLQELAKILELSEIPERIECYDISNISGSNSVGVCVVFENGEPAPRNYRKFNIKSVVGADDYSSMREVVYRRINRAYKEQDQIASGELDAAKAKFLPLPDLILLDGGKGHVSTIKKLFATMGEEIPVFGMVKDDKHRTRGITSETAEFAIPKNGKIHRFLTRMQDEVHRFAISAYRKKHTNEMTASELENIPNVGPTTRRKLLERFKSAEKIKSATLEELCEVTNKTAAKNIYEFFENRGE